MDARIDPLALLALQIGWGADEALAEVAVNRLAARPAAMTGVIPAPAPQRARVGGDPAPPSFEPTSLEEWRAAVREFAGCALRTTATNPVLAEGDPAGGLLVIGEPPEAEDDRGGRPFSGAAGTVLDRILPAIGLQRSDMLLAPLIPWRPPGGRPPTDVELAQCLPLLHRLIGLSLPRHVVLCGVLPVRALLGSGASLRRLRGRWTELSVPGLEKPVPVLPTFGLGSLKSATDRRAAWADWRMLRRGIRAMGQ